MFTFTQKKKKKIFQNFLPSNELKRVKSNEQRVRSNWQRAKSDEQRAKSFTSYRQHLRGERDLANTQLMKKFDKGFTFSLYIIDIHNK